MGLAVVVGLQAEARLARRLGVPVFVGGGHVAGAAVAAQRAIDAGATALLSFGLAGGLDPALRPGTLIIPSALGLDGAWHDTDAALTRRLGGPTPHRLLCADAVAAAVADKQLLFRATGAAALDLESGAVLRAALAQGVRFAALRVVCDPAEQPLPPAALAALHRGGAIGVGRVVASVLAHPGQLPALLALAADAARARRVLARHVATLRLSQDAGDET